MSVPSLCQACHKYHHATVVKACPFCDDVQFPEEMLCDLVRDNNGDEHAFHCEAFRPTLSVVNHDQTEAAHAEEVSDNTRGLSQKDKWFQAYAVQQLGAEPDLIYANIQYHVVFSTRQRVKLCSSEHAGQIPDILRQAALPFDETTISLLCLSPDHIHLYIAASPDYALDEIVQAIREHLDQAMMHLFPTLQHSHPSCWERAYFAEGIG